MTTSTQIIQKGYKQTEIGVIPAAWETTKAGDIGRFRGGNGFPTRFQGAASGDYPFYKVSDMNNEGNDTFMFDSNNWISEEVRRQINARVFPAGGIIFAKVGAAVFLERKKILTKPSCIDNNLATLLLDTSRADTRYIHYVLHSIKFGALVSTTALPSLSGQVLSQIILALPALCEQAVIATALSDTDALIDKLDALLEKKKNIKQGAMQELLIGKRRLPGFSGEWEKKTLGEIAEVIGGGTPSSSVSRYWNGDINWFTPTEVGLDKYIYQSRRKITEEGLQNSSAKILNRGTILLTSRAGIGDLAILKVEGCTNQGFQSLSPGDNVDGEFLYYMMLTKKGALLDKASGSTFLEISPNNVKSISVQLPPKREQVAIAEVLSDMDADIQVLESQLTKYQNLKQGMMQVLLTGKIRLLAN